MILIDIEMPERCGLCPCFHEEFPMYCKLIKPPGKDKRIVAPYGLPRPEWCPMKEQEAEAKWIYGEDKTGVDGWYCSECNFFEPWFYEFTKDIDFIRFYGHCPKCGRRMTSYTGKPTQERR